jgi:hypothetical protein
MLRSLALVVKSEPSEKLMKCSKLSADWLFNLINYVATASLEDEPAVLWRMLDLLDAVGSRITYPPDHGTHPDHSTY